VARYRVPAVYPQAFFARAGGLMSYGIDAADQLTLGLDVPFQLQRRADKVIE
jgi:hypothetical protein